MSQFLRLQDNTTVPSYTIPFKLWICDFQSFARTDYVSMLENTLLMPVKNTILSISSRDTLEEIHKTLCR